MMGYAIMRSVVMGAKNMPMLVALNVRTDVWRWGRSIDGRRRRELMVRGRP